MLRNNSQKNDTSGGYDVAINRSPAGLHAGPQAQLHMLVCRRTFQITGDSRFAVVNLFFIASAS
jgi:hypothetical protein